MPELGDVGYWGLYKGGGRSSVCWALAWAGHDLEGFAMCFTCQLPWQDFLLLSLCAPCPLSPFLLLPAWGWRQEGERMEVGRGRKAFIPLWVVSDF